MRTKLNKWSWDAKKWREENGYTTPEWEMYKNNRMMQTYIFGFIACSIGLLIGLSVP